jgi:hypothetical protein
MSDLRDKLTLAMIQKLHIYFDQSILWFEKISNIPFNPNTPKIKGILGGSNRRKHSI